MVKLAARVELGLAMRARSGEIFISGEKRTADTADYGMLLFTAGGHEGMVLQLVMALVAGVILSTLGALQGHHVTGLVIVPAAPCLIEVQTVQYDFQVCFLRGSIHHCRG